VRPYNRVAKFKVQNGVKRRRT